MKALNSIKYVNKGLKLSLVALISATFSINAIASPTTGIVPNYLYAGGADSNGNGVVYKSDGTVATPSIVGAAGQLGSGTNSTVRALTVFKKSVIAGGANSQGAPGVFQLTSGNWTPYATNSKTFEVKVISAYKAGVSLIADPINLKASFPQPISALISSGGLNAASGSSHYFANGCYRYWEPYAYGNHYFNGNINSMAENNGVLFAGVSNLRGVFRNTTTTGNINAFGWQPFGSLPLSVNSLIVNYPNLVAGGVDSSGKGAIYQAFNKDKSSTTATWVQIAGSGIANGNVGDNVSSLVVLNSTIYAGSQSGGKGAVYAYNSGKKTWSQVGGDIGSKVNALAALNGILYAGGVNSSNQGVIYKLETNNTWTLIANVGSEIDSLVVAQ